MANTKIAPRRWPFPIGTEMIFPQASPPADWSQDTTKDDYFLRVVIGVGGGENGSVANNTLTTQNQDIDHNHPVPGHSHTMSHTHGADHKHGYSLYTRKMYDGSEGTLTEGDENYVCKDDGDGFDDLDTNGNHLATDASASTEGCHNHDMEEDGTNTTYFNTGASSSSNTSGTTGSISDADMDHTHSIPTFFRPKYKDIIFAVLVQ